jgi:hypothetical protein
VLSRSEAAALTGLTLTHTSTGFEHVPKQLVGGHDGGDIYSCVYASVPTPQGFKNVADIPQGTQVVLFAFSEPASSVEPPRGFEAGTGGGSCARNGKSLAVLAQTGDVHAEISDSRARALFDAACGTL